MEKEKLKELLKKQDDYSIALSLLDIAHKDFNENNFYYFDFSINIFGRICQLVKDGVVSLDRSKTISREVAKLINESIDRMRSKED